VFNANGGVFSNSKEIMHLVTSQFCMLYIMLTCLSLCNTQARSDSRCPMRWWRRYSGSRLLETRNRQRSWEVTLYNLLPRVLRWF